MSTEVTSAGSRALSATHAPTPLLPAATGDTLDVPPVAPAGAPSGAEAPIGSDAVPLGRSGIDARDVLLTRDALLTRGSVTAGEVEQGLQQARGALLRRQPSEALASLDAVWQRADSSEEAWYLRSGALTVMGMPEEGDRIAGEALQQQPTSVALRLAQSVARTVQGDLGGARDALLPALDEAPDEPVLIAQRAVLNARAGRTEAADEGVRRLLTEFGAHPAHEWARSAVRQATAERVRQQAGALGGAWSPNPMGDSAFTDVTDTLFRGLGASLPVTRAESVVQEARVLLRAFSGGGTMATVAAPEQAHAARAVLVGLIAVLTGRDPGVRQPGVLLAQLVPLLRDARLGEAARALKRGGDAAPPAVRRLLEALVSGPRLGDAPIDTDTGIEAVMESALRTARAEASATSTGAATDPRATRARESDAVADTPIVQGDDDEGAVVPLRLGLGLLRETAQDRAVRAAMADGAALTAHLVDDVDGRVTLGPDEPWRVIGSRLPDGTLLSAGAEGDGTGWGAAREAAPASAPGSPPAANGMALVAVVAVLIGGAVALRGGAVAVLLLGAVVWYALRPTGRRG